MRIMINGEIFDVFPAPGQEGYISYENLCLLINKKPHRNPTVTYRTGDKIGRVYSGTKAPLCEDAIYGVYYES